MPPEKIPSLSLPVNHEKAPGRARHIYQCRVHRGNRKAGRLIARPLLSSTCLAV